VYGAGSRSIACSTMFRRLSASCWPAWRAARNAWSVRGYFFAHALVATYHPTGKFSVAPWSRSQSSTSPMLSASALPNGSGSQATSMVPFCRACPMKGKFTGTKCTSLAGTPYSASTELMSSVPMLFLALTPIRAPLRSDMVVIRDLGRVYRAWLWACISEPSAMISRSERWPTWSWM
jgi:hypothetical protein